MSTEGHWRHDPKYARRRRPNGVTSRQWMHMQMAAVNRQVAAWRIAYLITVMIVLPRGGSYERA